MALITDNLNPHSYRLVREAVVYTSEEEASSRVEGSNEIRENRKKLIIN